MVINRWDESVEKAWLSLFRFIEFWMGLPYINPNEVSSTLSGITEDPRLPGGDIDTEYVDEKSSGGAEDRAEEAKNGDVNHGQSNRRKTGLDDALPEWLKSHKRPKLSE